MTQELLFVCHPCYVLKTSYHQHLNLAESLRSMPRCCPQCPRETLSPSGLNRHRQACKIYQQSIDSRSRLLQYTKQYKSILTRRTNTVQPDSEQQIVDIEEPGPEADFELEYASIQTDNTVSF
jgi:hypothetical protein